MREIEYHELKHGPVDPNRARHYAWGLSALGCLFALLTVKTNWDYFEQYYDGFAFWARVIPFFAVEAAIVVLPLFKGYGSKAQGNWALGFEVALIFFALLHTYLVSDYSIAKLQAGKTKTEASADYDRRRADADRITKSNKELQENHARLMEGYNRQMRFWNDAAYVARREGRPAPPAPQPPPTPQFQEVPQLPKAVIDNSLLSVEAAGESRVSHQWLQRLLFLLIGLVTASVTAMVLLADGSRVKAWLLGRREGEIRAGMTGQTQRLTKPDDDGKPDAVRGQWEQSRRPITMAP